MTYALKSIKLAGGEETPRFEATITKDGKRIGVVSNGGTGGCCSFHFADRTEQAAFKAWISANHPAGFEPEDGWVYKLLSDHEERKALSRTSKRKTVFRLDGETNEAGYRSLSAPYRGPESPAGVWLHNHHAGKGDVFDPATKEWTRIK